MYTSQLQRFFSEGNERSLKVKRNILQMIFYKGGSILTGLLLVPITLNYVDSATYGIWLALSSMIAWFSFFDIGLSNGLRNRLCEALAKNDYDLCRKYISTTYAILIIISVFLQVGFVAMLPIVDWRSLLKLDVSQTDGLIGSILVISIYFCANFVLNTINTVILADQRPADASMRAFLQQLVSLILIFILTKVTTGNLLYLCSAFCLSQLAVCLIFNVTLFRGRYKKLAPSIGFIDFSKSKDLMSLGVKFFIIQIAGVIQYQMINFLILRYYGASDVTSYNISYKYFSVMVMVWGIITTPLWSAVTNAKAKGEYKWIDNTVRKYLKYFLVFSSLGIIMLLASPFVYSFWIGEKVNISMNLSIGVFAFCLVQMFSQIYVQALNGLNIVKLQAYACCISPFAFLAFFYWGLNNGMGLVSVVIAAIVCNFNGLVLAPIQFIRTIKQSKNVL